VGAAQPVRVFVACHVMQPRPTRTFSCAYAKALPSNHSFRAGV
jgi:hypothetical protein